MKTEVKEHHGRISPLPKCLKHRMLNTFVCFKCRRSYTHGLLIRVKETEGSPRLSKHCLDGSEQHYSSLDFRNDTHHSSVGMVTRLGRPWFHSSHPYPPDRLWGTPSLSSDGYRGIFPLGQSGRCVKLISRLRLLPTSSMVLLYLRYPHFLHGGVLN
jgi:hypothetical protein